MTKVPLHKHRCANLARCFLVVVLVCFSWLDFAPAVELRSTNDFHDIQVAIDGYADQVGAGHVLLVLDLDNTILAMNQSLGSEQWFDWQSALLKKDQNSSQLVAKTFDGLLKAQGLLFDLGQMHPPQRNLPQIINEIQGRGIATVVLTARGSDFRDATERELNNNGYRLARSALTVHKRHETTYLPYDITDLEASGLTATDAASFKLNAARPVSYQNGIMLIAGQHKGALLLTLLHDADREIKAVVAVDNREAPLAEMHAALTIRGFDGAAIRYCREDASIESFEQGDKTDVTRQWERLSARSSATCSTNQVDCSSHLSCSSCFKRTETSLVGCGRCCPVQRCIRQRFFRRPCRCRK